MPRKIVAIGVPVLQAMKHCGCAALTFSICAETLTSVMLKCAVATICIALFSGSASTDLSPFSASWPVASVLNMSAIRVQPFMRK